MNSKANTLVTTTQVKRIGLYHHLRTSSVCSIFIWTLFVSPKVTTILPFQNNFLPCFCFLCVQFYDKVCLPIIIGQSCPVFKNLMYIVIYSSLQILSPLFSFLYNIPVEELGAIFPIEFSQVQVLLVMYFWSHSTHFSVLSIPCKLADGSRDLIGFEIDAFGQTVSGVEFFYPKAQDI